jgi:uncharacterized protein YjbI with pentapeptide repeats
VTVAGSSRLADQIAGRALVEAERFERLVGRGELADVELDGCVLDSCDLEGMTLRRVVLRDCELVSCNLSGVRFVDVRMLEVILIGCKALGVAWNAVTLSAVAQVPFDARRCRLDLGTFAQMDLRGARMTDCSLREGDFSDADLRGADLTASDLLAARFARADLRDACLVDVPGHDIDPRETRLAGARFSPGGALGLLGPLGIEVV